MPSITLKNIPDELYAELKLQAKRHHRSMNGEILHCLEGALRPRALSPEKKLDLVRRARVEIDPDKVLTPEQMKAAIEEGRE